MHFSARSTVQLHTCHHYHAPMLLTVNSVGRWKLWLRRLQDDLRVGRQYDAQAWHAEVMAFTLAWTRGNDSVPVHPHGDPVETALALCIKWHVCSGGQMHAALTLPVEDTR